MFFWLILPEAVTGCAPPDFKVSRPKGKMATTEQPFVTFETTTLYLPQYFTTHDLEFVDGKAKDKTGSIVSEQIDKNTQKDASKVKENPYWFEDWIVKDSEPHYHSDSNVHHHHHHHNTRRAKRNHYRKLKTIQSIGNNEKLNERILAKRSVDYQDDEIIMPDEVLSPSDVIENIFNANDTIQDNINGVAGNRDVGRSTVIFFLSYFLVFHERILMRFYEEDFNKIKFRRNCELMSSRNTVFNFFLLQRKRLFFYHNNPFRKAQETFNFS